MQREFYLCNHSKYRYLFKTWVSNIIQNQIDEFSKQMYNKENKILQNMKFKRTIIITNPCYVVKDCTEKNPYPLPWTTDLIHSPNIAEMIK